MTVKSLFLLGVVLAIALLVCQDTVHARELTTANDLKGNVEPAIGPDVLKEKKLIIGIGVYPQPGFGGGFNPGFGGFNPGFGGGFGGLGNNFGFGGPDGFQPGFGGGFGGPGNGFGFGGFNDFQPAFNGGF